MGKSIRVFLLAAAAIAVMCGAAFAITAPTPTVISVYSSAEQVESDAFSDFEGDLIATCPRVGAPTAVWNSKAKTFAFQRGRGFNEGKYIYTVSDSSDADPIAYEVWVVDPATAANFKDMAVKTDASDPKFDVTFSNANFSLSATDPDHPAAWENPRDGNGISTISYTSENTFTIVKGVGFDKSSNPVLITVNGVLKFRGKYIEGAKDSGTLGSFLFTVNDFAVEPASIKWNSRGTRENVAFTIADLKTNEIDKVEHFAPGETSGKALAVGDDYTATPSNSDADTRLTFSLDFLSGLRSGNHRVRISDKNSTAQTVDVIIRVTDGSTDDDVRMDMDKKFGIGDPIVAKLTGMTMHNIRSVELVLAKSTDVTPMSHFEATSGGVQVILSGVLTEALHKDDRGSVAIKYDLGLGDGEKVISSDFTITEEPSHDLPRTSISPDKAIADSAPQIAFGAPQTPATQFDVEDALRKTVRDIDLGEYINDDGKLTDVAAKALLGNDKHLKTLPSAKMHLPTGKTIAPITFVVDGENIVSNDEGKMSPADAIIHKVVAKDGKLVTEQLEMADGTITDGTYQIYEVLGGSLAEEVTMKRPYRVVVYVEDNEDYDLDATKGVVLDPVIIETSEGAVRTSSSSGGSCGAGAGAISLIALAALTIRKRGK